MAGPLLSLLIGLAPSGAIQKYRENDAEHEGFLQDATFAAQPTHQPGGVDPRAATDTRSAKPGANNLSTPRLRPISCQLVRLKIRLFDRLKPGFRRAQFQILRRQPKFQPSQNSR